MAAYNFRKAYKVQREAHHSYLRIKNHLGKNSEYGQIWPKGEEVGELWSLEWPVNEAGAEHSTNSTCIL